MPAKKQFSFTGRLEPLEDHFISTAIFLPKAINEQLPPMRCRAKGKMNSVDFSLAVQYRKSGRSFFAVSAVLSKKAGMKVGDIVKVSFQLVDPEKVDLPEELVAALEQDLEGKAAWNEITPGLQRSLCVHITSVKNVDSRIERALFIINKAKTGAYSSKKRTAKTSKRDS